jgi:hypothetical protein
MHGSLPLHEHFTSSRLIPLAKPGGSNGVRPIAIGEAMTRIASRAALTTLGLSSDESDGEYTESYLLAQQFGVKSKGGVEPIIWSIQSEIHRTDLEEEGVESMRGIAAIDFSNAFNTIRRERVAEQVRQLAPGLLRFAKYAYGAPSPLLISTADGCEVLHSFTGVRQGDSFGPLFFSLAMRPLIEELKAADFVSDDGIWAYLDDITMEVCSKDTYEGVLSYLEKRQAHYGPKINKAKSWFKPIGELKQSGAPLLGSWVGGPQVALENGGYQLVINATEQVRRVFLPKTDEHGHVVPPLVSGLTCQEQILLLSLLIFFHLVIIHQTLQQIRRLNIEVKGAHLNG